MMKKTFLILSLCGFFAACGGSNNPENTSEADNAATSDQVTDSSNQQVDATINNTEASPKTSSAKDDKLEKGHQLIAQSDCLTCHKEQEKLVGPAYVDVAKKYEDNDKNMDYLANKIIEGGSGVWGQIPMTPHPAISKEDAKEMAKYVLSLND